MSLYLRISFEIYQFSIILIVIGFSAMVIIYLNCDTVWMNCNIKQTVGVLKLVSNALFRLQTEQGGFVLKVVRVLQRSLLKLLLRETLPAKKKQFERLRSASSPPSQLPPTPALMGQLFCYWPEGGAANHKHSWDQKSIRQGIIQNQANIRHAKKDIRGIPQIEISMRREKIRSCFSKKGNNQNLR